MRCSNCRIELNGCGIIYLETLDGYIIKTIFNNKLVIDLNINVYIVLPDHYSYSNSDFVINECIKKAEQEIRKAFGCFEKISNEIDETTFRSLITSGIINNKN